MGGVAELFWYVLGATALVSCLLFHSPNWRKRLESQSEALLFLGRISYSLYLTHIPVMYTLTSWLFLYLESVLKHQHHYVAAMVALILSLPAMFIVAYAFSKCVDQPAIRYSNRLAAQLLCVPNHSENPISANVIFDCHGHATLHASVDQDKYCLGDT
jgi:peptidoglycan/LPS O-acetylase OafA/YrhL